MIRAEAKEAVMRNGLCNAEYVDQLCERCWKSGRESCPYVPKLERQASNAGEAKQGDVQ